MSNFSGDQTSSIYYFLNGKIPDNEIAGILADDKNPAAISVPFTRAAYNITPNDGEVLVAETTLGQLNSAAPRIILHSTAHL